MAITKIYKIKSTAENSLNYIMSNKESEIVEIKNDSNDSLNYIMRDKKSGVVSELSQQYLDKMKNYITYNEDNSITFKTISSGINCSVINTYEEWQSVRNMCQNGNKGILQYDIIQNFGIDLDPEIAHQIGIEFAEKYLGSEGYQCIVSTHINTGYVHNHIEFNACNAVTLRKFHDCLKTINDIRKISDDLCKKYELQILQNTQKMNLVKFVDENGKIHFYEPTARKDDTKYGEYANKNDYRNTESFLKFEEYKYSHVDMIKDDIEKVIPYVDSYEQLLAELKNLGYEIKDKRKDGSWRSHVTFKFATWERGVRDSSIGENDEYGRENLERRISEIKNSKDEKMVESKVFIPESDDYIYGSINIDEIDEEYRIVKQGNVIKKVDRSNLEKDIIKHTKLCNNQINGTVKNTHTEQLISRINANLKTLKFVEEKNITSFVQIQNLVTSLYEKRKMIHSQINNINESLDMSNEIVSIINKYKELSKKVNRSSNEDVLLKKYGEILNEAGLSDEETQEKYINNYNKFSERFYKLQNVLSALDTKIEEYNQCVETLNLIDKSSQRKYQEDIKNYYINKNKMEKSENQKSKRRE